MADLAKQLAALPKAQPLDLAFNASFGSRMVLQQAPARAAVYGTVRSHAPPHVAVRVVASVVSVVVTVGASADASASVVEISE